jgi:hypothetical protein
VGKIKSQMDAAMSEDMMDDDLHIRARLGREDVRKMLELSETHPERFVCIDIDGALHDLSPSGYHISSEPEGRLHHIHANYPPDEIAEIGFDEVHRLRGLNPIPVEFLVTEAEHARMLRDGVLDVVDEQNVLEALCHRSDALLRGQREN